jgi:hypothetical protein
VALACKAELQVQLSEALACKAELQVQLSEALIVSSTRTNLDPATNLQNLMVVGPILVV